MRWPWSRSAELAWDEGSPAPLDLIDVDELEILELSDDGRRIGPAEARLLAPMPELGYSKARDGTGVAGIWQTLAGR